MVQSIVGRKGQLDTRKSDRPLDLILANETRDERRVHAKYQGRKIRAMKDDEGIGEQAVFPFNRNPMREHRMTAAEFL